MDTIYTVIEYIEGFYDGAEGEDLGKRFATREDAEQHIRDLAIKALNDPEGFIGDPAFDTCTEDDIEDFAFDYEIVEIDDPHAVLPLAA